MTRMKKGFINQILFICLMFLSTIVFADGYQSVDDLKKIANEFILKNVALESDETIDIKINPSDMPGQLAACNLPVEASFPNESTREKLTAIELTCRGDHTWHVFMPVNVAIYTKVVVAKRTLSANEMVADGDLDYAQVNINSLYNGYFKDKAELNGQTITQMISSGAVISKRSVRKPQLVHRNQEIDLVVRINSIEVSMKAVAKSDGGLNDTITAYNPASKRLIEAVVVGSNKAEVVS